MGIRPDIAIPAFIRLLRCVQELAEQGHDRRHILAMAGFCADHYHMVADVDSKQFEAALRGELH
jgi:hypothetical protein